MDMYTETKVINRDWRKLKDKHGERWAKQYFRAADRLFNPNETKIIRYQYSGVVTEEIGGKRLFHAIADIGLKSGPRVVFIIEQNNGEQDESERMENIDQPAGQRPV